MDTFSSFSMCVGGQGGGGQQGSNTVPYIQNFILLSPATTPIIIFPGFGFFVQNLLTRELNIRVT